MCKYPPPHPPLDSLELLRNRWCGERRGVVRSFPFEAARFERAQARHRTSASHANRTTTARIKHLTTEISKQHPEDMKFTRIIGVAAMLLGVAFASSAEMEEVDTEIAALRGKVSRKMESAVSIYFDPLMCILPHSPDGFFWAVREYFILLDRYVFDDSQQVLMCIFSSFPEWILLSREWVFHSLKSLCFRWFAAGADVYISYFPGWVLLSR